MDTDNRTLDISDTSMHDGMHMRIQFESAPVLADVLGLYCANPTCECRDATLNFYEGNGTFEERLFQIVLNYETWKLSSVNFFKDDEAYPGLVHEFMEGLDDSMKAEILSGIEVARAHPPVLRDDAELSALDMDMMLRYADIYEMQHFEYWVLAQKERSYLVMDYYCAKPDCDCQDVLLSFQVLKDGAAGANPVLVCRVGFATGRPFIEERSIGISEEAALRMYEAFADMLGGKAEAVEACRERYQRIKAWSRGRPADRAVGKSHPADQGAVRSKPAPKRRKKKKARR